jgi:hypothetical protein
VALDAPNGIVYYSISGHSSVTELDYAFPTVLNFAPTALGSISSDSPQTVTINNTGNDWLDFLAIGYPKHFPENIAAPDDCYSGGSLNVGESCTLTVEFAPKTLGYLSGYIVLVDNSLYAPFYAIQEIPVEGTGLHPQAITFTDSLPSSANYSAGLAYTLSATGGGSGNPVTFSLVSGPATVVGSTLTITAPGTVVIAANQAGNATYAAAPQATQSITIKSAPQTITFTAITATLYAGTQITLSATASSGLPVTLTSVSPTVCTVSGATASLLTGGTCYLHASQAGNADYAAAPTVTQDPTVHFVSQTITFPAITGTHYALGQVTPTATASSGLPITYTSMTPTICTVSGSTVSLLIGGVCYLHASQAGNAVYSAAPTILQDFAVSLAPQTINFPAITGTQYALGQVTLTATASSGLPITYTSMTPTVCTVSGSTVSLLMEDTCYLHAAQAGNAVYAAASTVTQSFVVHPAPQTITFTAITGTQSAGTQLTLSATASSGLPVTFTSITTSVCTVSGSTLTLATAGTCTVHASQAGNSVYAAAPTATQSFTVKAAS